MASGFFVVLDDIAALMDDVAVASKIATRKTAGILGDDLAVNAEKATGFLATRELPVLWAITKGSFINKLIIIPVALLLNFFFPIAIKIILVLGGFYLAYEGMEKIVHYLLHRSKHSTKTPEIKLENNPEAEKAKIKSAVTTDFILSVEIVIITLGSVLESSLTVQILTTAVVAILATVGVYGIVALIVRTDDAGYKLIKRHPEKGFFFGLGNFLVNLLPWIIRILTVLGTLALILVSGGIFIHNIHLLHNLFPQLPAMLREFMVGMVAGLLVVGVVVLVKKIFRKKNNQKTIDSNQ